MYFSVLYSFKNNPPPHDQFMSMLLTQSTSLGYTIVTSDFRYWLSNPSNVSVKYSFPGPIVLINNYPCKNDFSSNSTSYIFEYSTT